MDKLKIFTVTARQNAVAALRYLEPLQEMKRQDLIGDYMVMNKQTYEEEDEFLKEADILWTCVYMDQKLLMTWLKYRKDNPKLKIVVDIDDNNFEVNPTNPVYGAWCTDETYDVAGVKIFNHRREQNLITIKLLETALREADAITSTTGELASTLYQYNENIYLRQNSLLWKNWNQPHIPVRNDGFVKIGWSGGNTHALDWLEIHIPLVEVVRKNRNTKVELITTPGTYDKMTDEFPKDRFNFYSFINYDAHPWRMNVLKPDIGVAPLHEDPFSVCKSDLRFTEYAALGVPVIASNIPPYSKSIKHGITGFLANNKNEWKKYLNVLIKDEDLRIKIGQNAKRWAEENRKMETQAKTCKNLLQDIMTQPVWHVLPRR